MADWQGKTRGGILGHRIFVFFLHHLGLNAAYFLLRFVSFYYFLVSRKSNRHIFNYFKKIRNFGPLKARISVYRNYYRFGQILIDKVAIYSNLSHKYTFNLEDEKYLAEMENGGFMISAHVGNWEMSAIKSGRIKKTINMLMVDAEHRQIKDYLESVMTERSFRVIPISDDLSHLITIRQALDNQELIAIHGDRYQEGAKTLVAKFFGQDAWFPEGPFYLAIRMNVPVSFAFAMKNGRKHYHFYATPPKKYPHPGNKRISREDLMPVLSDYILALEKILTEYPEQWFNYYEFWKK